MLAILTSGLLATSVLASPSPLCSIVGEISPAAMVQAADAIVRAVAVEYRRPPADPTRFTTGVPDSIIRFKIVEVLQGDLGGQNLELPGYLSEADDFNDHSPPYTFVRPGGRAGSCIANTYKRGAEFLLMLKRTDEGYTVNWYALGPVNEQLRSPDDAWLQWVRREVK